MEDNKMNNVNKNNMNKDEDKKTMTHKVGDTIERFGEKVAATAPGIGKAIHDAGNKIEHMGENKSK